MGRSGGGVRTSQIDASYLESFSQVRKPKQPAPPGPMPQVMEPAESVVIRYNWIEDGNRQLDLVETDFAELRDDPSYRRTLVYGNLLIETADVGNSQIVHYGGDGGDEWIGLPEKRLESILAEDAEITAEDLSLSAVVEKVKARAEAAMSLNLQRLVNASGVIVHTNLGRSLLSEAAADNVRTAGRDRPG